MKKQLILILGILLLNLLTINLILADSAFEACTPIEAGGTYYLTHDLSASGTCITISRGNVILDGRGFNINSTSGTAILIDNEYNGIVIKNANINSGLTDCTEGYYCSGISFFGNSNNTLIINNTINIKQPNANGIFIIGTSVNDTIIGNTFNSIDSSSAVFYNDDVSNGTIYNNTMRGNSTYAIATGLSSNTFDRMNVSNNFMTGGYNYIYGSGSSNSRYFNNIMTGGSGINFVFLTASSNNDIFRNNYINGSNGIQLDNSANNVSLIDNFIGAYFMSGNITITNSTYGSILLFNTASVTGKSLIGNSTADILIGNNSAYVNSAQSGLNKSAKVTLYNTGIINGIVLRNGVACSGSICSNLVNIAGTNYSFDVTGWSNYSIGSGSGYNITNCMVFATAGSSFLNQNVNVTYTYTYLSGGEAGQTINDTGTAIAGVITYFPLFITIGAMVVLILLTVLIIVAIRGSGLMQVGTA